MGKGRNSLLPLSFVVCERYSRWSCRSTLFLRSVIGHREGVVGGDGQIVSITSHSE